MLEEMNGIFLRTRLFCSLSGSLNSHTPGMYDLHLHLYSGHKRTRFCNFTTFTVILKIIVESASPVVSPRNYDPVCVEQTEPQHRVSYHPQDVTWAQLYLCPPLVPACSGFPMDCECDREQMRRSCRTAGPLAVSALPWPYHSLHAPHRTTSHQCLQGFSIQSAKTASSLPLASIHIPAAKLCPLPTAATQHLDHPCQPASSHSPRSTAPFPTAVKSSKPQKRAGKTDRMANQITQWHSRYYEGLFCILCNMSGKPQRMHTCSTTSQLNGFLPEGFLKQQSPRPVFH